REGGGYAGCDEVPTAAQAADWLNRHAGRVLLTTGSKELEAFTAVEGFAERLFVRVLPLPGVVEKCAALGFPASRIIAMQGPFTEEFNRALLRQLGIELLVTKDTGDEGGFSQKLEAARACCARVLVIRRPDEPEGALAPDALWRLLEDRLQQEATQ
ncbi:MAG: precorrin-6A/cobalt-precorrin-6A reductase, partial [Oscillospiraceae bacterium]